VCAGVQTSLQGHQQIQTALSTVKAALAPCGDVKVPELKAKE